MPNQLSINTCRVGWAGGITAGGRGGAADCPRHSHRKICADLPGKEGAWKNGEKKENQKVKGRWKIGNGRRKSYKMRRRLCFPFHFSKPLKYVLGLRKWEFSTGKRHFTSGKKSGKIPLSPLKKYSSYTPGRDINNIYGGSCVKWQCISLSCPKNRHDR